MDLTKWVNNDLLPNYPKYKDRKPYCNDSIINWMHERCWSYGKLTKGVYVDGHERHDVVEDRNRYLHKYKQRKAETVCYNDSECSDLEADDENIDISMIDEKENEILCNGIDKNGILWKRLQQRREQKKKTYINIIHDEMATHVNEHKQYGW